MTMYNGTMWNYSAASAHQALEDETVMPDIPADDMGEFMDGVDILHHLDNLEHLEGLTPWELEKLLYPPTIEEQIIDGFYIYASPVLLLIATVGNIISMFVLSRLSRHLVSTCLYLAVCTITDLIQLYIHLGNEWLIRIINTDLSTYLMTSSEVLCKLEPFITDFTIHLSKWLIVAAMVENLVAVRAPAKSHKLCSHERARAVVLLLVVLLCCVNVHYFWSYDIIELGDEEGLMMGTPVMCSFARYGHVQSQEFVEFVWPILSLLVAEVLPTITVTICTFLTLSAMCRGTHHGTPTYRRWQAKYILDPQAVQTIKYMLATIGVCYTITNVPTLAMHAMQYLQQPMTMENQRSSAIILGMASIRIIGYMFLSCKIVIYITCGRFRKDIYLILCHCCVKKKHKTVINFNDVTGKKLAMVEEDNVLNKSASNQHIPHRSTVKIKPTSNGHYANTSCSSNNCSNTKQDDRDRQMSHNPTELTNKHNNIIFHQVDEKMAL